MMNWNKVIGYKGWFLCWCISLV